MSTLLDVLKRRIYVTIVVAILTIGLTVAAVMFGGRSYRAEGSVVIFPPETAVQPTAGKDEPGNPYLMLDNLAGARDLVLRALGSRAATQAFTEANPGAKFEATPDYNSAGPILVFTATADTPEAAGDALDSLIVQSEAQLTSLQNDLDLAAGAELKMRVVAADDTGVLVRSKIIRTAVLAAAGISVLGILLIALIDAMFARQRSRAKEKPVASSSQPSGAPPRPPGNAAAMPAQGRPSPGRPTPGGMTGRPTPGRPANGSLAGRTPTTASPVVPPPSTPGAQNQPPSGTAKPGQANPGAATAGFKPTAPHHAPDR